MVYKPTDRALMAVLNKSCIGYLEKRTRRLDPLHPSPSSAHSYRTATTGLLFRPQLQLPRRLLTRV